MTIDGAKRAFKRKLGAVEDKEGDHIYYYLLYQGSEYTVGKLSHSWRGTLNDTQINMLAKKLYLKKNEFEAFVKCTLSVEEFIKLWQWRRATLE